MRCFWCMDQGCAVCGLGEGNGALAPKNIPPRDLNPGAAALPPDEIQRQEALCQEEELVLSLAGYERRI